MSKELVEKIYRVTDTQILGFFKDHRFLSNFHNCDIEYEGHIYTSTEAAFQAAKSLDPLERRKFTLYDPAKAKQEGRKVKLRPDWDQIKDRIMLELNMIKYTRYEDLKEKLLETRNKELVEENWWGDRTWGRVDGVGQNKLGKLLMAIREELKPSKVIPTI